MEGYYEFIQDVTFCYEGENNCFTIRKGTRLKCWQNGIWRTFDGSVEFATETLDAFVSTKQVEYNRG